MDLSQIWNLVIVNPMLNSLIVLSGVLFGNFGLAIIVLTIVVRVLTLPLTLQQLRSTKVIQVLQPKLQEIQKKYARDRVRLQKEMMGLYKEAGVNPVGCLWPMLVQFPIWIALYQTVTLALGSTPEDLIGLSQQLYSWPLVRGAVPLNERFLWLDLGQPDNYLLLAVLVAASMWVQQKMVTAPAIDPRQAQMNNMTLMMMPLMFGVFALQFPAGLSIYWIVSNVIGIIIQYFISGGWGYLLRQPAGKTLPAGHKPR